MMMNDDDNSTVLLRGPIRRLIKVDGHIHIHMHAVIVLNISLQQKGISIKCRQHTK